MLVSNDMVNDPRVSRHAETLANRGFKVTVICPITYRTSSRESRDGYEIRRVKSRIFDYLSALSNRKTSLRNGTQLSFLFRAILAAIRISALQLALLRAALNATAHVYCSNDFDTLPIGVLCARFDRRLVYDSHELWTDMLISVPSLVKAILQRIEGRMIGRADAVMTVNEFIARELRSRYALDQSVHVIHNYPSVQTAKLKPRRTRAMKKVLYQGRYSPQRGLENLVMAADYLLPDVEIVLRGFGEIEEDLRNLASHRVNVRFEKPVIMQDLIKAARDADVGVVSYLPTNLCNFLASPNKLFEYIHAGLAVAASDMPFLRKIVQQDEIGVLFDPCNPQAIADALNKVTRGKTLARCKENSASVASKYTWKLESEQLLQLYRELDI